MRISKSLQAEVVEAAVNMGTPVGDILIDIPKKGLLLFNAQDSALYYGDGTNWIPVAPAPVERVSNVTLYTAPDPHITIVQETQTFSTKIFSGSSGGVHLLEFYNSFTGRPNGTPQLVNVSIADLPGFDHGWSNWNTYTNINTPSLFGVTLATGSVTWLSPTLIQFRAGNNPALITQDWKFSFVDL
jgi:hypothetical protein